MSSPSSSHSKSPSGSFRWPFSSSKSKPTPTETPSPPPPPPPFTLPSSTTLSKDVPMNHPVPCVVKEVQDGKSEEPTPAPTTQDVQDGSDGPQATSGTANPLLDGSDPDAKLDIVFVQDTTASQSPYIVAAKQAIETICDKIVTKTNMKKDNIRFGLIAFRDHPPQDRTYVTKEFPFTSDMPTMQEQLKGLRAQGGGDGPEAVTAALAGAFNMPWDKSAAKMIVLITDAPPHGIGEANDGFDASPDQNDPLELARQMAEEGITLFMVACEPTLSTAYVNAVDFYAALTDITGGKMLPLTMAGKLGDYIAGNAVETIETERLIKQYKDKIVDNVYGQGKALEEVVEEMQKDLDAKDVQINTYEAPAAYVPSAAASENQAQWKAAKSIGKAREKVQRVEGSRYTASPGLEGSSPYPKPTGGFSFGHYSPAVPSGAPIAPSAPPPGRFFSRTAMPSSKPAPLASYSEDSSPLAYASPPPPPPPGAPSPMARTYIPPPAFASDSTSTPAPQPSLFSKKRIDLSQTKRVVMQSMARSSKVTESGMTRKTDVVVDDSTSSSPAAPPAGGSDD